jgi:glycerate kinase
MNNIVIMPDSFKGTLSSTDICNLTEKYIHNYFPNCKVTKIPVADGGEGTVQCLLQAKGGESKIIRVKGPFFDEINAAYALLDNKETAIIELASAAGLPMVEDRKNVMDTTTYGVGQLIKDALYEGANKIIIGLGGSCTNDGGCGLAAALGIKFYDESGHTFIPVGRTLKDIVHIDASNCILKKTPAEVIVMCDIDNPLYGLTGAAYIFGPQKGADADQVIYLDAGLRHLAAVILKDLNCRIDEIPGGGAAGGAGAGLVAFAGGKLQMGIDTVLDVVNFNSIAAGADYVITGEGRLDSQSLRGKVIIGIAKRAKMINVPVIAIVGDIGSNIQTAYDMGVTAIFSTNCVAVDFSVAKTRAEADYCTTIDNLLRLVASI